MSFNQGRCVDFFWERKKKKKKRRRGGLISLKGERKKAREELGVKLYLTVLPYAAGKIGAKRATPKE